MTRRWAQRTANVVPKRALRWIYSFGPLTRLARALVNASVPTSPTIIEVLDGEVAGMRMRLDLRNEKYFWSGNYESLVQHAMAEWLRPGANAWDIGGFIGFYTLLMKRKVGADGQVVVLEPDPDNLARLAANLDLNGFDDVVVLAKAAGSVPGRAAIRQMLEFPAKSEVVESENGTVEVVTLDQLLGQFAPPSLVKIDVEGMEEDVLAGSSHLLREVRPALIVEIHGPSGRGAVQILEQSNYRLRYLGDTERYEGAFPLGLTAHVLATPN